VCGCWADPEEPVRVSFQGETGEWQADKTGTLARVLDACRWRPYESWFRPKSHRRLHDVLVRDVVARLRTVEHGDAAQRRSRVQGGSRMRTRDAGCAVPKIRLFLADHRSPLPPKRTSVKRWLASVTPENGKGLLSGCLSFCRELYQRYKCQLDD